MKKYVVIEDLSVFDCYTLMLKGEYKRLNVNKDILFTGTAELCNQWIIDNPHPKAGEFDDEDDNDFHKYYI